MKDSNDFEKIKNDFDRRTVNYYSLAEVENMNHVFQTLCNNSILIKRINPGKNSFFFEKIAEFPNTFSELEVLHKKFDVFISHASADKQPYANKLCESLGKLGVNYFYDEKSIEWGDSLKDTILKGIEDAEFAIIIISENFFGREWTELELDNLLKRQNTVGQKIILPILYNVSYKQFKKRYPDLSGTLCLDANNYTTDEIALEFGKQLITRLKNRS